VPVPVLGTERGQVPPGGPPSVGWRTAPNNVDIHTGRLNIYGKMFTVLAKKWGISNQMASLMYLGGEIEKRKQSKGDIVVN